MWNVKHRIINEPLPMHFTDIKHKDKNGDVYKIDILLNTKIQFETPHNKREIPHRMRCRDYKYKNIFVAILLDA